VDSPARQKLYVVDHLSFQLHRIRQHRLWLRIVETFNNESICRGTQLKAVQFPIHTDWTIAISAIDSDKICFRASTFGIRSDPWSIAVCWDWMARLCRISDMNFINPCSARKTARLSRAPRLLLMEDYFFLRTSWCRWVRGKIIGFHQPLLQRKNSFCRRRKPDWSKFSLLMMPFNSTMQLARLIPEASRNQKCSSQTDFFFLSFAILSYFIRFIFYIKFRAIRACPGSPSTRAKPGVFAGSISAYSPT